MIGNGSFGVVYQARLIASQEMVAIKKVLQDKRFKVRLTILICLFYYDINSKIKMFFFLKL